MSGYTSFFGGSFFGEEFFHTTYRHGGKDDNAHDKSRAVIDAKGKIRYVPFKPTGLVDRPRKEGRKEVTDRVDESAQIAAEIASRLAREFGEETQRIAATPPIAEMSLAQIDNEIGVLLRNKLRTEEEEIIMLLLIAATA